jgi:RNA polymerase sigma-54 factor
MLQQSLYQSHQLRQELALAPHQIQSLELLTAPYMEIQALVDQELMINPALERAESTESQRSKDVPEDSGIDANKDQLESESSDGENLSSEMLIGDPMEEMDAPRDPNHDVAAVIAEKDEFLANLMQMDQNWWEYASHSQIRKNSTDDEEKRQHFFDSLTTQPTLIDDLLEQLRTSSVEPEIRQIGEAIIGNIAPTGYFRATVDELAHVLGVSPQKVEKALRFIQTFDPPGVGARNLRESLLLQMSRQGKKNTLAYKIVDKHLDLLKNNRIPEIAKLVKSTPAMLYDVIQEIRKLQPRPGNLFESEANQYILPEVIVDKNHEGQLQVTTKDYLPAVRISPRYLKLLNDPTTSSETKMYLREKINSARLLIKGLDQRQSTIRKIADRIVTYQNDFFHNGDVAMRPLTMNQIAEEIGVHETTVSRAVANKFMQTPQGIFPLRHFFNSGYQTDDGESLSNVSIKSRLQEIISTEDSSHPISDQEIVAELKKQGLNVARRTISKYREELGIPSTHKRRNFV